MIFKIIQVFGMGNKEGIKCFFAVYVRILKKYTILQCSKIQLDAIYILKVYSYINYELFINRHKDSMKPEVSFHTNILPESHHKPKGRQFFSVYVI
jgi:hypothetical protein